VSAQPFFDNVAALAVARTLGPITDPDPMMLHGESDIVRSLPERDLRSNPVSPRDGPETPCLSVCIPTHDGRAEHLRSAIDSVLSQVGDDLADGRVQVCVSDNASRDRTAEIMEIYRRRLGANRLVYHRNERNLGFTENMLRVVAAATGSYCWLLGSDDTLEPGSIADVLALLEADPALTGITTSHVVYDVRSPEQVSAVTRPILPPAGQELYVTPEETFSRLGLLFDFLSTQIVHRERWLAAVKSIGSGGIEAGLVFPLIPIMVEMVRRAPRWRFYPKEAVRHRVGTSNLDPPKGSEFDRYQTMLMGDRARVWAQLFGRRSELYRILMNQAFVIQANPYGLAHYKLQPGHTTAGDLRLLVAMTRWFWFLPQFWIRSLPVLLVPHALIPALGAVARRFGRERRASR